MTTKAFAWMSIVPVAFPNWINIDLSMLCKQNAMMLLLALETCPKNFYQGDNFTAQN